MPDPSQILTHLDLFTVVALQSAPTVGRVIGAYAEPQRLIFRDGTFYATRAALTNPNVIQMFNVVEIGTNNPPPVRGPFIRFDPDSPHYYWQLPIDPEIILAMVICRFYDTIDEWEELQLIQQIHTRLLIRDTWLAEARRGRGRGGGRGDDNRGRGGRGRGRGAHGRGGREAISRLKEPQRKRNCWEWGLDDEFEQASDLSREQVPDLISPSRDDFD